MASAPTRAPLRTKTAPAEASDAPPSPASPTAGAVVATSPQAHAVALPGSWKEKLAIMAKDQAAKERPSVSKISLRAGQLKYGDQPVKGNVLPCIVLLAAHRNTYYTTAFDPNNLANPACFSVSVEGENMVAHENVPDENIPPDDPKKPRTAPRTCEGCAFNAWESDPKGGRGKACKEGRRLIILPADAAESAEAAKAAEMAIIDIPVTSGKNYSNFVNGLAAAAGVPPWAALTNVSTQPDAKTQFKVTFTPTSVIEDEAVLEALHARMAEAERIALQPYDEVESTTAGKMADAPTKGKSKF